MESKKEVVISGHMPFAKPPQSLLNWLGHLNTVGYGLKIQYGKIVSTTGDNGQGGRFSFFTFIISGQENIGEEAVGRLLQALVNGGAKIGDVFVTDIEAGEELSFTVPDPITDEFVVPLVIKLDPDEPRPDIDALRELVDEVVMIDLDDATSYAPLVALALHMPELKPR